MTESTKSAGMTEEREAFEAWAKPLGDSTWREKNDRLLAWQAWEARAALSASSPSPTGEPTRLSFDEWIDQPNPVFPSAKRRDCFSARVIDDFRFGWEAAMSYLSPPPSPVAQKAKIALPATDTPMTDAAGEAFNNMFHKCRAEVSMAWWQRIWAMGANWALQSPLAGDPSSLRSALNAMLTQFGMDEDPWSKPTFDQARKALSTQQAEAILFEHEDGRLPKIALEGRADFTNGEPKWHRVGPVDVSGLQAEVRGVSAGSEVAMLREALQFYADGSHFWRSDEDAWDTVSGEPKNFWCDEAGTATVEDGTVAAMALRGTPLTSDGAPTAAPGETATTQAPIDMVLYCPACHLQHIDAPDERTPDWKNESHRSHLCHGCGYIWRPADVPTNGVQAVKTKGKADSAATVQSTADGERAPSDAKVEAAAKVLAACMDYPWEHMPEQGRVQMRANAKAVLVATPPQASPTDGGDA